MKCFKVFVAVCISLVITMSYGTIFAATYPVTKTECVNVAEGKPVVSSDAEAHTIAGREVTNLTDGDRSTYTLSEFGPDRAGSESFTIDLLRRCKVEKIEIFDSIDTDKSTGRANFDIIGANSEDFSDAVTLGSLGETDDMLFPHAGAFVVELDGENAYRYIKLQRTASGDYRYAEIRVWASLTVTDIARDTDAANIITDALNDGSHWIYDRYPPEAVFDGDTSTAWVEDGNAYRYFRVDLGKPYHVGMIEMTPRDMSASSSMGNLFSQKYIKLYGSNTDDVDNAIFDPYSAPPADTEAEEIGYKLLAHVGVDNPIDGEKIFPSLWIPEGTEAENGAVGKFQATVNDTKAFQYFTYKHYVSLGSTLSTFALYVIHPEVNSGEVVGDTVYVNFSDEMDTSTLNDASVTVYVDDEETSATVDFTDDYTMAIKLDKAYFDANIKVVLSDDIQNQKEVSLVSDTTLNLFAPPALEISEFVIQDKKEGTGNEISSLNGITEAGARVTVKNNLSAEDDNEDIILFTVLYDENNTWIKADEARISLGPLKEQTLTCGFDVEGYENCRLAAFVWRDFKFMKPWIQYKITE